MNFEDYLISKNIDCTAFLQAEPGLWENWKMEFEQMHSNSFTAQKLYLINPIRKKYKLDVEPVKAEAEKAGKTKEETSIENAPSTSKAVASKPVFRPKPKMN